MKKIALLVNSTDMLDSVNNALAHTGSIDDIDIMMTTTYEESVKIGKTYEAAGGQMIIARGGHARALRASEVHLPIITIPFTGNNIAALLVRATNEWEEFALIGNETLIQMTKELERPIGAKIHYFTVRQWSDFENIMLQLRESNIKAVIGGYDVVRVARQYGIHDYCIQTSEYEIISAIIEAREMLSVLERDRHWDQLLKATLNTLAEGVVVYEENRGICYASKPAVKLLGEYRFKESQIPEMHSQISNVFQTGKPVYDELYEWNESKLTASFLPLHERKKSVVIVLQKVQYIHKIERNLRQKLANKGLVAKNTFDAICAESPNLQKAVQTAKKYAIANSTILINGETGTGKEMFAQSIHNYSARNSEAFVAINCATIPSNLLESELFGYVEGAFTGAKRGGKIGLFELAHKGTIFLDEIGETSLDMQARLLRVLEEHEIMRVGDDKVIPVDIRIIAATNRDLWKLVQEGKFRSDFYYRLDVLSLKLPPLRECRENIEKLTYIFTEKYAIDNGIGILEYTHDAMQLLKSYEWRGNVRELKNVIERVVVTNPGSIVDEETIREMLHIQSRLPAKKQHLKKEDGTISAAEMDLIKKTVMECGGNKTAAAKKLGISRPTLHRKLKHMGGEVGDNKVSDK